MRFGHPFSSVVCMNISPVDLTTICVHAMNRHLEPNENVSAYLYCLQFPIFHTRAPCHGNPVLGNRGDYSCSRPNICFYQFMEFLGVMVPYVDCFGHWITYQKIKLLLHGK